MLATPRDESEAIRIATERHAQAGRTGLRKQCPRCERWAWVFRGHSVTLGREVVTVVWDGKPRGGADTADLDEGVAWRELLDPEFGCGFDAGE